jgi:hypothetical protein
MNVAGLTLYHEVKQAFMAISPHRLGCSSAKRVISPLPLLIRKDAKGTKIALQCN